MGLASSSPYFFRKVAEMKNEIIEDVWKAKDELARQFEYDLDRLATALRQKEQEHGFKVVDFSQTPQLTDSQI